MSGGEKAVGCFVAVVLVLFIVAGVMASHNSSDTTTTPNSYSTEPGTGVETTTTVAADAVLFPGRMDAQPEDRERNVGRPLELSGYTVTVTAAGFHQSLSSYEDNGYVVVEVTIANRDDKAQSYSYTDWRLQTPNGQVIDPGFTSESDGGLGSADLVHGGTVSGKVVFEVGAKKGDFFIIWKPDMLDAARGIWKVTVF